MTEKNLIAQLATKQDPRKNHARQYKTNSSADLDNLRTEIRKRLSRGDYTTDIIDFSSSEHKVVKGTAEKYICQIRKELKEYYQQNKEDFLSDFHNKYQYLYNELVKQGQFRAAKDVLDSQVKLSGLLNQEIGVTLGENSKVTISFGFDNNNAEE